MNNKIGFFGGTFNPIHIGHLIIAQNMIENLSLDKLFFIPASVSPFKTQEDDILPSIHRVNLIKLSISDNEKFDVDDFELSKGGISYTYETVEYLADKYQNDELYWLIGGDQILNFDKWKNYEKILETISIVIAKRPNTFHQNEIFEIEHNFNIGKPLIWLDSPLLEISSSEIRNLIKLKYSIKYLVTKNSEDYIIKNNLFMD